MSNRNADQLLVAQVLSGNKKAFDLLVKKYQQRVVSIVGRYVDDFHECQDVAQDVFIKAYRALPNFRQESAFYTWLYRIAINTAKNHIVARARRVRGSDLELDDQEQYVEPKLHDVASPERLLMADEIERVIYASLAAMSEDLRVAITLREFDGLSYEEIAQVMECPVGTVRSRIFRAREDIDSKLAPLLKASE
ncbi:MAG: RNA polymerase sigma factor RpoE [Gammaproteobacteria bacterium]|nr:MAG: RNA polymerase sigma factor RpoE [Gammaproteobacteria bacterium]